MAKKQSKGACVYCEQEFAKGGMARHLKSCSQRKEVIAQAAKRRKTQKDLYHLRVEDAYSSAFWLDLEMTGTLPLKELDNYLRAIWLECCGHMSQFSLGGAFAREVGMRCKISDVFQDGTVLTHVYDFGTTSETEIKFVNFRQGIPVTSHAITLMARNLMPEVKCMKCQKPASYVCMECVYEDDTEGTLCEAHAQNYPHDNYGEPMPLLNSPRTGMCGYEGPADPPY